MNLFYHGTGRDARGNWEDPLLRRAEQAPGQAFPARMLVCPGSPVRPRDGSLPSVAKITIEGGAVVDARIVELKI